MTPERRAAERLAFRLLCVLLLAAAIVWVVPEAWDKLSPFIIGIPLAAVLQPVVGFLQRRLKMNRSVASLLIVLLLLVVFLALVYWLFTVGIEQVSLIVNHSGNLVTDSISSISTALNNLLDSISNSAGPGVANWLRGAFSNMTTTLSAWGSALAEELVGFSVSLAASMPYVLIYISFLTIGLYFITHNYDEIRSYLPGGTRRKQDSNATRLTKSAVKSLAGYLRVQCTFGLMVWVLSWIYLACFGFKYAGITALFAGFMELIPMIGSGAAYFVLAALQFLLGNPQQGLQLLILTLALQLLRRILEPKLMSDSIGISPLQSLIGMFVGMRVGGIIGLIGGPVLMSVLVGAYHANLHGSTLRDIHLLTAFFRNRWKEDDRPL